MSTEKLVEGSSISGSAFVHQSGVDPVSHDVPLSHREMAGTNRTASLPVG
ncbi:hypothetical protein [Micromonospora endolithica]|nr:hypothetical protein [Micromonospora endolithica]